VGVKVQLHMFLTSPLDVNEWLASHPGCNPGEYPPNTHQYDARWATQAVWRFGEKIHLMLLLGIEPQFLRHPAYSLVTTQSELHWLP